MFEVFWFYLFFKKGRCFSLFFIGKLFGMTIASMSLPCRKVSVFIARFHAVATGATDIPTRLIHGMHTRELAAWNPVLRQTLPSLPMPFFSCLLHAT